MVESDNGMDERVERVVADGFESGDTSAWTSSNGSGGSRE